jgi:hypothetical protein
VSHLSAVVVFSPMELGLAKLGLLDISNSSEKRELALGVLIGIDFDMNVMRKVLVI